MRKAIVISLDINALGGRKSEQECGEALRELNQHLEEGWNVVQSFPMSGTSNVIRTATVVVLEKDLP